MLRRKLAMEYDAMYPGARRHPAFRFAAAGVCAMVMFFMMGTGVYAYESPEVAPGHALYPMKTSMEAVESQLARTPEQRARFHVRMTRRRLQEAETLLERRQIVGHALLSAASQELGLSVDELRTELRDPESREAMVEELAALYDRYEELLSRVPQVGGSQAPLADELREKLDAISSH